MGDRHGRHRCPIPGCDKQLKEVESTLLLPRASTRCSDEDYREMLISFGGPSFYERYQDRTKHTDVYICSSHVPPSAITSFRQGKYRSDNWQQFKSGSLPLSVASLPLSSSTPISENTRLLRVDNDDDLHSTDSDDDDYSPLNSHRIRCLLGDCVLLSSGASLISFDSTYKNLSLDQKEASLLSVCHRPGVSHDQASAIVNRKLSSGSTHFRVCKGHFLNDDAVKEFQARNLILSEQFVDALQLSPEKLDRHKERLRLQDQLACERVKTAELQRQRELAQLKAHHEALLLEASKLQASEKKNNSSLSDDAKFSSLQELQKKLKSSKPP